MKEAISKRKLKINVKTIFLNYLKFYNVKQEMNLGKVNCSSFRRVFDFSLMNNCFI